MKNKRNLGSRGLLARNKLDELEAEVSNKPNLWRRVRENVGAMWYCAHGGDDLIDKVGAVFVVACFVLALLGVLYVLLLLVALAVNGLTH